MPIVDNLIAFTLAATRVVLGLLWAMALIGATRPLAGLLRLDKVIQATDLLSMTKRTPPVRCLSHRY